MPDKFLVSVNIMTVRLNFVSLCFHKTNNQNIFISTPYLYLFYISFEVTFGLFDYLNVKITFSVITMHGYSIKTS